jgi:hypothetical protein
VTHKFVPKAACDPALLRKPAMNAH